MQLKDCKTYTRVKVWVNPQQDNDIRRMHTQLWYTQLSATIGGQVSGQTLLVWKQGETIVKYTQLLCAVSAHYAIEDAARTLGYHMGCWVANECECDIISESIAAITPSTTNVILSCKKCGTFAQYAQPNQTDGSFVCYSCRR